MSGKIVNWVYLKLFVSLRDYSMEKIFSKFNHPIVCAHRGASAYAPENTLSAFQKALDLKTDMVELDVQSSRDNQLFIMHDLEVDRTTDGSGKLAMLTASELASLDAGSWFDEKFKGEPVPQFDAALSLIRGKATFNIEVKCNGLKSSMIEQIIEKI
ncbi:MAG: hypothetical protein DWQ10_09440 [Calditrichaeota bacterium]|nr:MAG: hypothetical protein DWQ10_09440 [Calditrichota bacterium]